MNMETNNKTNPDFMLTSAMKRTESPSPELLTKVRYNTINERPAVRAFYNSRRVFAVAAVIVTLIALGTVAVATNIFRIQDTALPRPEVGDVVLGRVVTDEMVKDSESGWITAQPFSLQGFEGSPEHAAHVEWMEFLYQYDVNRVIQNSE